MQIPEIIVFMWRWKLCAQKKHYGQVEDGLKKKKKKKTRTEPFQGCGRIYYMGKPLRTSILSLRTRPGIMHHP